MEGVRSTGFQFYNGLDLLLIHIFTYLEKYYWGRKIDMYKQYVGVFVIKHFVLSSPQILTGEPSTTPQSARIENFASLVNGLDCLIYFGLNYMAYLYHIWKTSIYIFSILFFCVMNNISKTYVILTRKEKNSGRVSNRNPWFHILL